MRILITGASRGIGYHIARKLNTAGNQLWLCGKSESILRVTREFGSKCMGTRLDVGSESSVTSLFSEIENLWHGLDAVINTAAILGQADVFWELDSHGFEDVVNTNTLGSFRIAKSFVRLWLRRSRQNGNTRGKVVLFAGGGAGYGFPKFLPYGTSKAGVVRMCETMAMELAATEIPIDINVVAPGANETAMLQAVRAGGGEVRTVVPFSKPVALCEWLLSTASDGVTGRFLHVNDAYQSITASDLGDEALKLRRRDL